MILNDLHNEKVDIWSLGVLFYEMLYWELPFRSSGNQSFVQREVIEKNIIEGRLQFKSGISEQAKSLLKRMLEPEPKKRPGAQELLEDSYFEEEEPEKKEEELAQKDLFEKYQCEWEMNQKFIDLIKKQDQLIKQQQKQIDELTAELKHLKKKSTQENKPSLTTEESEQSKIQNLSKSNLTLVSELMKEKQNFFEFYSNVKNIQTKINYIHQKHFNSVVQTNQLKFSFSDIDWKLNDLI